jgi:hypothetical protein
VARSDHTKGRLSLNREATSHADSPPFRIQNPQTFESSKMSLLCQFLQDSFESSISSIIDDNAKTPSDQFREYVQLKCLSCPGPASAQCCPRHHTVSSVAPANAFRVMNRRHSEPLQAAAPSSSGDVPSVLLNRRPSFSTAVNRWEAAIKDHPDRRRDVMLRMPTRFVDKWGVTRNRSDSALLVKEEWSGVASVPPGSVSGSPRQELANKDSITPGTDEASYIVQHPKESTDMPLADRQVNTGLRMPFLDTATTIVSCEGSSPNAKFLGADCSISSADGRRDEALPYNKDLVCAPSSTTTSSALVVPYSDIVMVFDRPYDASLVSVQSNAEQKTAVVPAYLSPLALLMT